MVFDRLIILPCHSIWKAQSIQAATGQSSDEWHLASFQIEGHDHLCFIDHIRKSFDELKRNPHALLIISGGQTKAEAGPISEALSYYQLAQRLIGTADENLLRRVFLEEYARDSLENVIFLICRFYEIAGLYPKFITVVGFEFKKSRFLKYHLAQALDFPESLVEYIGNAPLPGPEIDHEQYFSSLVAAEKKHALDHFATDLYGLRAPLQDKRKQRDPFNRHHGYESSNPKMKEFLSIIKNLGNNNLADEEIKNRLQVSWT
ncbi:hypothetical protein METBIDRAFT_43927 [Metschnikowia bicuspidata var. bicuspidata NRRL YB-4993]|uniref:DUF218 domain-containing protein n=1 Tax=Metschnikowia bicuspidata var. bicuspidata NRRL YB-4993 TaxID=869754 RepID=A0A1A0H8K4_9ASCO|nr:hypothetical protein METBIDRAFT_43927 [Metschnikowia bicuspidata var. bicuspidata NRRL YB-4993]OBA20217.1 hypothetical protein METBIDRAFT_43927 [Metschnikowia bicuspidata var. bicuspidata NRRL YB-4993]